MIYNIASVWYTKISSSSLTSINCENLTCQNKLLCCTFIITDYNEIKLKLDFSFQLFSVVGCFQQLLHTAEQEIQIDTLSGKLFNWTTFYFLQNSFPCIEFIPTHTAGKCSTVILTTKKTWRKFPSLLLHLYLKGPACHAQLTIWDLTSNCNNLICPSQVPSRSNNQFPSFSKKMQLQPQVNCNMNSFLLTPSLVGRRFPETK